MPTEFNKNLLQKQRKIEAYFFGWHISYRKYSIQSKTVEFKSLINSPTKTFVSTPKRTTVLSLQEKKYQPSFPAQIICSRSLQTQLFFYTDQLANLRASSGKFYSLSTNNQFPKSVANFNELVTEKFANYGLGPTSLRIYSRVAEKLGVSRMQSLPQLANKTKQVRPKEKLKLNKNRFKVSRAKSKGIQTLPKNTNLFCLISINRTKNNTHAIISNLFGENKTKWSISAGQLKLPGGRRKTRLSQRMVYKSCLEKALSFGYKFTVIHCRGTRGSKARIFRFFGNSLSVLLIKDTTGAAHNGCRPPKVRRV